MRHLILAVLLGAAALVPTGTRAETVRLGDRFYDIALPADPKGAPLILALHGGGGSPAQFARSSGLGAAAVAAGFAVAFPAGSGRAGDRLLTWNGGYCCGHAMRQRVDDVAFLRAVLRDAADRFGVDGSGVFVTGMSNGAILAETFAAREPALVRAVAGVAGTMDTARVSVGGPVPALILHGTDDRHVPFEGGVGADSRSRTAFASVPSVVGAFLAPWGGGLVRSTRRIDAKDDGTAVEVTDYTKDGKPVLRLMSIEGGGHLWPGKTRARGDDTPTREIDANAEILRFFALYR